jgi:hypothetical protein
MVSFGKPFGYTTKHNGDYRIWTTIRSFTEKIALIAFASDTEQKLVSIWYRRSVSRNVYHVF